MGWVFRCSHLFLNKVVLVVKEWPCAKAHQTRSVLAMASRGQLAAAVHIHGWFVGPLFGSVGQLSCEVSGLHGTAAANDQLKGMMDCKSSWKQPRETWVIVMSFPCCLGFFINCTWQTSLPLLTFSNVHMWPLLLVSRLFVPWWGFWWLWMPIFKYIFCIKISLRDLFF